MLLGGRLGDTIGRKRTFIVGVALFTIASILCGIAWDESTLVTARLLQGVGAAIASPTGLALIATTFPKGPGRNAATAVFAAMTGVGSVMGLVVGGALTEVSWRWAFLVNVPIGLLMIHLARKSGYRFAPSPGDWKQVRFQKQIDVAPQNIPCETWRVAATEDFAAAPLAR